MGWPGETVFEHMRKEKAKSACAYMQSDQGFHCLLTDSFDTTDCINGEHMPRSDFCMCRMNLNLPIFCMLKDTFSRGAAK